MSLRSYKKEIAKKREEERILNALKSAEKALARRRDEYVQKAKEALRSGNRAQYTAYVSLLKNAIFNLAQAQDMTANFIIVRDMREMQTLSDKFVRAINSVLRDVYKTSKSIHVASSQRLFLKALDKQQYTAAELKTLLEENNIAYASSVTALTDVSDEDVKALLSDEIERDDKQFDASLDRLEKELSAAPAEGKTPARAPVASAATAAPARTPAPAQAPAPAAPAPATAQANAPAPARAPAPSSPRGGKPFDVDNIAFRPQYLKDYVGQPNVVAALTDPIKKARLTGKALPHILICGSYGQGKTTLAKIIANEMGGRFITISAGIKQRDMLRTLRELKPNDILFVDEVHKLASDVIETLLYPAMEDFEVHFTETKGPKTTARTEKIAPFTLIGATTETGKLLKPFYSKFPINVTLADYALETIAAIVKNSFRISHIEISDELATAVAKRSRLSPRMANAYVNGIGALAIVREAERRRLPDGSLKNEDTVRALGIHITEEDVRSYFDRLGIDELGLKEEERKILRVIIEMYGGGPVGQENIAKALNMANNRIDQEYEPYLAKLGFINVRPQGRFVTAAGYRYLGYPVAANAEESDAENGAPPEEPVPAPPEEPAPAPAPAPEEPPYEPSDEPSDELPTEECTVGAFDGEAAKKISALFAGEGKPIDASLDDLFAGVSKEYDSAAKNRCFLHVSNGRELYCDSELECKFLKVLFAKGFITDARTEALELDYSSRMMSGKRYYPDFVLKLHDGRVAIVEMKNLSSMGYHLNVDKYECLAAFCTENGYLYAEVGKDDKSGKFVSAEQIKAEHDEALAAFVRKKVEETGICTGADLEAYGYDVRKLMALLLNDRSLKNIDRTGANPQIVSAEE